PQPRLGSTDEQLDRQLIVAVVKAPLRVRSRRSSEWGCHPSAQPPSHAGWCLRRRRKVPSLNQQWTRNDPEELSPGSGRQSIGAARACANSDASEVPAGGKEWQ